ncbi:MAG: hypothetical protein QNJ54_02180 [Prochloraceae cyanobacterium]|nr:hypothetical protein [Prochloraceae cyanobacterium]
MSQDDNQQSLQELAWAIEKYKGQFALILARCNYGNLRKQIVQELTKICPVKIKKLDLHKSDNNLYSKLREKFKDKQPSAVMVFGLESAIDIKELLTSINQMRDKFRQNFRFPVVLWVTDEIVRKFIRIAPDFESWTTRIVFQLAPDELLEALRYYAEQLFSVVLETGADSFPSNENIFGSQDREINSALRDLNKSGRKLTDDLQACLQFARGRDAYTRDKIKDALKQYQPSLVFWQQSNHLLRKGALLFHMGLCHYRNAELDRSNSSSHWNKAESDFKQCLNVFDRAERRDLVAKFINKLLEVLRMQENWDVLQVEAEKSQLLHKTYGTSLHLAQDYGFLAEVALEKKQSVEKALKLAKEALSILEEVPKEDWQHQGLYVLLILARSQHKLNQHSEAIANLKRAKNIAPENNVQLYIQILDELRRLYLESKKYLKAFEIRQERRSIEYEYGRRAFIGAVRLKPKRFLGSPKQQETVAEEIDSSDERKGHIQELRKRIAETQHKLTVIYGQSGVGKSSLMEAGLIPALKEKPIGSRDVLPILLRFYDDWERELLGQSLAEVLVRKLGNWEDANPPISIPLEHSALLEHLRENDESRHLLTVLIFDEFEDFFFSYQNREQLKSFAEFFRECLKINYLKIIISLREDRLHSLLLLTREVKLDAIENNILDKSILYHIDNFSPEDAKSIILSLTKQAQFYLEHALVEKLVEDLTNESEKVRPIELQVVGTQLQEKKIRTLEEYRQYGPKKKLIQNYLQEVVKNCGPDNQNAAELVLFLLTEENDIRPPKTRAQLERELKELAEEFAEEAEKLTLVLEIFVNSGLVLLLRGIPVDRYQLVHDYLVSLIREQQLPKLQELKAKFEEEKKQRQKAEVEKQKAEVEKQKAQAEKQQAQTKLLARQLQDAQDRTRRQKQQLIGAGVVSFLLLILSAMTISQWRNAKAQTEIAEAQKKQVGLANLNLEYLLHKSQNNQLDALVSIVKAGKELELLNKEITSEIEKNTLNNLSEAVNLIKERNRLEEVSASFLSVSLSPDNELIATASYDGNVKLWDRHGKFIKILEKPQANQDKAQNQVWCVTFSPDGEIIATASADKTVKLSNSEGTLLNTLRGHQGEVKWVSFRPDGQKIATASADKTVKLWNSEGTLLNTLSGHEKEVYSVSFSPDGNSIASSSQDKTVKLWSIDGELINTLKGHEGTVWSVSFSPEKEPDKQIIATASADRTVKLWKRDGTFLKTLKGHEKEVKSVSFSPDGQTIASAGRDDTIKLWTRGGSLKSTIYGHRGTVNQVSFTPDGKIASASSDFTVRLWNVGLVPAVFQPEYKVSGVSFSPDSQTIASASNNNVILWSRKTGKKLNTFTGHTAKVNNVRFSHDGERIASASNDKTVKIWSKDGKLLQTLFHHDSVWSVSFSPDDQLIATASDDKTLNIWDWEGKLLHTLKDHTGLINDISFSPDGKTIASASDDNTVKLWTPEGKLIPTNPPLKGDGSGFSSVSFDPLGQLITAATANGSIKLWKNEGDSWQEAVTSPIIGHKKSIYDLSFHPEGQMFASGSRDGTVKIWNRDGFLLATLEIGSESVVSLNFSRDSKIIWSTDEANRVSFWNVSSLLYKFNQDNSLNYLLRRACDRIRNYLKNNPNVKEEDKELCDEITTLE